MPGYTHASLPLRTVCPPLNFAIIVSVDHRDIVRIQQLATVLHEAFRPGFCSPAGAIRPAELV